MPEGAKPRGYLDRFGERLLAGGYEIIPIVRGSKRPRGDDWQHNPLTRKSLRQILARAPQDGVGVLTRKTPGVDIDVRDEGMVEAMKSFVQDMFPGVLLRIGDAPKSLFVFKTDKPFTKVMSGDYIDPDHPVDRTGKPLRARVEVLGDGQQFVAYAIHPDTHEPYKWPLGGILKVSRDELPTITQAQAKEICAKFDDLAQRAGWKVFRKARADREDPVGDYDEDDPFNDVSQEVDIEEDELKRLLMLVPNAEEYEQWRDVGMALWEHFKGDPKGLEWWHEWSINADNYEAEALDSRWPTFDIQGKGRQPVTARFIIKHGRAAEALIKVEQLAEVKQELVASDSLESFRAVCEKIKHIDFDRLTRTTLLHLVKKQFAKVADGAALGVADARSLIRYENPDVKSTEPPPWCQGWTYCENDATFWHNGQRQTMAMDVFNAVNARHLLTRADVLEGKARPDQAPADLALNVYQIPTVASKEYNPQEGTYFERNGVLRVNSYDDRNVPYAEEGWRPTRKDREAVELVKAHVKHLFADEDGQRTLVDWLSWIVKNPGLHVNWAVLVQGAEGDGKTLFNLLMHVVLGPENVGTITATALEEKYNSWAEGHQFVFVEEVFLAGHNRHDVLNKVKPLITNEVASIRRMNVDWYDVPNRTSYMLTTNFLNALPLSDGDSRYYVLMSRFRTQEQIRAFKRSNPKYYSRLIDAIRGHGTALREWLLNHELSPGFNAFDRAPESQGKREMIRHHKTEEAEALELILAESGRLDMTADLLNATDLPDVMQEESVECPQGRALNALLSLYGFSPLGRLRHGDVRVSYWSRNPAKFETNGKIDGLKVKAYLKDAI